MKKIYITLLVLIMAVCGYFVYNKVNSHAIVDKISKENLEKDLTSLSDFEKGIDKIFDQYIARIPDAVKDRPKYSLIFKGKENAAKALSEHFNKEVFSEEKGGLTWTQLINDFHYELEAHKNDILLQVGVELSKRPLANESKVSELEKSLKNAIDSCIEQNTKDILVSTILGIAAEEITRFFVTSGITATCTAIGAGSGSIAGPVGTGVGIVVGFSAGWVADYMLEKKQNKELVEQFTGALEKARVSIKEKYKAEFTKDLTDLNNNYKKELLKFL